jgi:cytochrome c oxidase subunit 1
VDFLKPLQPVHNFITWAAFVTAGAQIFFLWNFFWSLKHGAKAGKNPWNATTLEWDTDSPPPLDNFGGHYPSVYRGPYEFSVPGAVDDFVPQHLAPAEVARTK